MRKVSKLLVQFLQLWPVKYHSLPSPDDFRVTAINGLPQRTCSTSINNEIVVLRQPWFLPSSNNSNWLTFMARHSSWPRMKKFLQKK
ncbi:hypothetical protein M758_UG304200 [Ceratodon purpureus]|nr:hypothetical protein M758_UG304200 [Ceratodon purpureus]